MHDDMQTGRVIQTLKKLFSFSVQEKTCCYPVLPPWARLSEQSSLPLAVKAGWWPRMPSSCPYHLLAFLSEPRLLLWSSRRLIVILLVFFFFLFPTRFCSVLEAQGLNAQTSQGRYFRCGTRTQTPSGLNRWHSMPRTLAPPGLHLLLYLLLFSSLVFRYYRHCFLFRSVVKLLQQLYF